MENSLETLKFHILNNIKNEKEYMIKRVTTNENEKRRLYDIGIINGAKIKLLYNSPSKKMKAYLVKDAIIAIRNSDASMIEVYDD